MQNFGVTNKEHYGMLWYFWSGQLRAPFNEIYVCLYYKDSYVYGQIVS